MKKVQIAFTLIELLVVIAIIGILSGLIIVGMSGMTQSANMAKAKVFSNSLRGALMMNLVSEWRLDGDASDLWGDNEGTAVGTTISTDCVSGSCYSFNGAVGSPQYINLTNSTSIDTQSKTIGLWFNSTNGGESQKSIIGRVYDNGPNDSRGYFIWLSSGNTLHACVGDSTANFVDASKSGLIVPGKWFYVTMTHDYSSAVNNLKLYIDGIMYDQKTITGYSSYSNNTALGRASGFDYFYFLGKIDEVRYFKAALTTSQVKEQYYAGLNSLFVYGQIDKEEYSKRMSELAKNLHISTN